MAAYRQDLGFHDEWDNQLTFIFEVQKNGRTSVNTLACKWDNGITLISACILAVWILLPSCVQAEIWVIPYSPPVINRLLNILIHPTDSTDIRPSTLLFYPKRYTDSVEICIYSICNFGYMYFRFHVCHFDCRLNADRILHFSILKTNATTSDLFP